MSKKMTAIVAAFLLAVSVCGMTACSSQGPAGSPNGSNSDQMKLIESGVLNVGSDLAFPPFESLENGKASGFTIDIMDALCQNMGLKLNYVDPMKFDTLLTAVSAGNQIDAAAASITITSEREEMVDFTDPYLDSNQSIVVKNGSSLTGKNDFKSGMIVGVQSGTSGESWAKENLASKGATVQEFDDVTTAFAALEAGKIVAIVNDLPVDEWMVKESYTDCKIIEEIPTGEQYGIAVSKDDPALTAALNKALASIKADGTYDRIYTKWFGTSPAGK